MTTPETPPQTNEGWQGIEGGPLVTDAEIDALVGAGYDWHSAYRLLQSNAHSRNGRTPTPEPRA